RIPDRANEANADFTDYADFAENGKRAATTFSKGRRSFRRWFQGLVSVIRGVRGCAPPGSLYRREGQERALLKAGASLGMIRVLTLRSPLSALYPLPAALRVPRPTPA